MKKGLKTLSAALTATLVLASFNARAEEDTAVQEETTKPRAVLFKIHDIKPVLNQDGMVTDCDFNVTFYNRTSDSFRQAKLEFGWQDSVTGRYLTDEPQQEEKPAAGRGYARRDEQNSVARIQNLDIHTSVDMPSLGSYKQATVKASVSTDKCFLLLDSLNFAVSDCNIIGKLDQEKDSRRNRGFSQGSSACASLFEYVDSKNPEYYDEFKNISYSEQSRLTGEEDAQEVKDFEAAQKKIIEDLTEANKVLDNIK